MIRFPEVELTAREVWAAFGILALNAAVALVVIVGVWRVLNVPGVG